MKKTLCLILTVCVMLSVLILPVSAAETGTVKYGTTAGEYTTEATLSEAIAAANADTANTYYIQLQSNVVLAATAKINGAKVVIDLNGNKISYTQRVFEVWKGYFELTGEGTVEETVEDGYSPVLIYGSLNEADTNYTTVKVGENVTLRGWSGLFINQNSKKAYGVSVDFNGTIISPAQSSHTVYGNGIYINGQIQDQTNCPKITIGTNASVDAGVGGTAVYAAGYAEWTINGGHFIGESCIEIKAGKMTVNGGEFIATGTPTSHLPNGNGTSSAGYALAVVNNKGYAGKINADIKNGNFSGPVAILDDDSDTSNNTGTINIEDGYYSNDINCFVTSNSYAYNGSYNINGYQYTYSVDPLETETKVSAPVVEVSKPDTSAMAPEVKDAVEKAAENLEVAVTDDSALRDAAVEAAKEVTVDKASAAQTLAAKMSEDVAPEDITVFVQPFTEVKVVDAGVDAGKTTSVTLEITPMYKTVATTAVKSNDITDDNSMEVGESQPIETNEPVKVRISVPEDVYGIDNIVIKHEKKNETHDVYYYQAEKVDDVNFEIEFTVLHGFSTFTVQENDNRHAVINFNNDGASEGKNDSTSLNVGDKFPSAEKKDYTFKGWQFAGITGVYTSLTDDLLTKLSEIYNSEDNLEKPIEATALFEKISDEKTDTPTTGDNTHLLLWFGAAVCAAGAAMLLKKKKNSVC